MIVLYYTKYRKWANKWKQKRRDFQNDFRAIIFFLYFIFPHAVADIPHRKDKIFHANRHVQFKVLQIFDRPKSAAIFIDFSRLLFRLLLFGLQFMRKFENFTWAKFLETNFNVTWDNFRSTNEDFLIKLIPNIVFPLICVVFALYLFCSFIWRCVRTPFSVKIVSEFYLMRFFCLRLFSCPLVDQKSCLNHSSSQKTTLTWLVLSTCFTHGCNAIRTDFWHVVWFVRWDGSVPFSSKPKDSFWLRHFFLPIVRCRKMWTFALMNSAFWHTKIVKISSTEYDHIICVFLCVVENAICENEVWKLVFRFKICRRPQTRQKTFF